MLELAVHLSLHPLVAGVLRLVDKSPEENDVKAGWLAFAMFLALLAAVALIGWSFSRQMKKVERAKADGVFDDPADSDPAGNEPADNIRR